MNKNKKKNMSQKNSYATNPTVKGLKSLVAPEVVPLIKAPSVAVDNLPKLVPADVSSVSMTTEDKEKIRAMEKAILSSKIEFSNLELQILEQQGRKSELALYIKTRSQDMIDEIRKIAGSYGIDVNGVRDSRKWNLDTDSMIFTEVK